MSDRQDLFGQCNDVGATEAAFQIEWCSRCLNPECARSQFGSSRFEQRISNWEKKLFLEVPKLPVNDPRFPSLTRQGFVTIDTGRTPNVGATSSSWDDPRDLEARPEPTARPDPPPVPTSAEEPLSLPPGFPSQHLAAAEPASGPPLAALAPRPAGFRPEAQQVPSAPPRQPPVNPLPRLVPMNAPSQSGRVLQGGPQAGSSAGPPQGDKWTSPAPLPTPQSSSPSPADVKIVPRGAKIKLGG